MGFECVRIEFVQASRNMPLLPMKCDGLTVVGLFLPFAENILERLDLLWETEKKFYRTQSAC